MPTDPVPTVLLPGYGGRSGSGDGGRPTTQHITGMTGTAGRTDRPCETGPERAGSGPPVSGVGPCLPDGNGTVLQRHAITRNETGVDKLPDRHTVHTTKSTGRVNGADGTANRIADAAEHGSCTVPVGDRYSRSNKKDFKTPDESYIRNLMGTSQVRMPHHLQVGGPACMHRGATGAAAGNDDKSGESRHPKADDRSAGGGSRNQSSEKKEQNNGEKFDIRIRR